MNTMKQQQQRSKSRGFDVLTWPALAEARAIAATMGGDPLEMLIALERGCAGAIHGDAVGTLEVSTGMSRREVLRAINARLAR